MQRSRIIGTGTYLPTAVGVCCHATAAAAYIQDSFIRPQPLAAARLRK